jgi:predicted ArsR family transcriptional regulator
MARRRLKAAQGEPSPSALLEMLKRAGPLTVRALAAELGITYEAVRQQVAELLKSGWVVRDATSQAPDGQRGPASRRYRLSEAAEHLFPKHYDALSSEVLQHVLDSFGGEALVQILKKMTDARVRRFAPLLKSMGVKEKLKTLCSLYEDKDAYMEVEWRADGPALIERNCPFLNVAQQHPALCSVSVNTLERLLGHKVVREQRFQAGHGRCVFRVRLNEPRPADQAFTLEPPR